jgi:serine/threonine protein kinase
MSVPVCPSREDLYAYAVGKLDAANLEVLAGHVEVCPNCASALHELPRDRDALIPRLRRLAGVRPESGPPQLADLLVRIHALVPPPTTMAPAMTASWAAEQKSTSEEMPRQLDQYRILKRIGQGGMGTVYQAEHVQLGKVVALKVLSPERLGKSHASERFMREIQAIGRLDHPHIVRATDAREAEGVHFLVMEYVEGIDLHHLVHTRGPLPLADACELVRQAAVALQHIHEHGLVHRDIKPSNLMVTDVRTPVLKVLDLGLARLRAEEPVEDLTGPGELMGTLNYLAPEQATDAASVDIRADIYSLGCTLYYLLAGRPPFGSAEYATPARKLSAHLNDTPPPIRKFRADVPEKLAAVLDKMLAKDRTQRYETPAAVAEAIRPFTTGCDLAALLTPVAVPTTSEAKVPAVADQRSGSTGPLARPAHGSDTVRPTRIPFLSWPLAAVVAALVLIGLVVGGWMIARPILHPTVDTGSPAGPEVPGGAPAAPPKGYIDLMVWEKKSSLGDHNPERFRRQLHQAGVLPLQAQDQVRVHVKLDRPMYVYVIWISSRGEALPVYPWKDWKWERRPVEEQPVQEKFLPATDKAFVMEGGEFPTPLAAQLAGLLHPLPGGGPWLVAAALVAATLGDPGMETLMLLARDTPLPRDVDLAGMFAGLPRPSHKPDDAVVWFENGAIVTNEPNRAPRRIDPQQASDPVIVVQALLRGKLKDHFSYTRAVSFSYTGR